jgi:hypothetical protein
MTAAHGCVTLSNRKSPRDPEYNVIGGSRGGLLKGHISIGMVENKLSLAMQKNSAFGVSGVVMVDVLKHSRLATSYAIRSRSPP